MTIDDFNWQTEVGAYWYPYLDAAGLTDPTYEIFDIFLLAGLIMHDPVVTERFAARMRGWRPTDKETAPKSKNAYLDVLLTMSAEEKRALAQRVLPQLVRSRRATGKP